MSSASSTASLLPLKRSREEMQSNSNLLEEAERTLEHQLSLGNSLLKSIDAEWLEQHKDLLDIFVQNPNDPAFLEQIPQASSAMELCPSASSEQQQQTQQLFVTSPGGSASQVTSDVAVSLPQLSQPMRIGHAGTLTAGQTVTTGFGDGSPAIDTPQRQASKTSGLRILHSARSDPAPVPVRSASSFDFRATGLVPEVSLAARAGSLGATSIQSSHRTARQEDPAWCTTAAGQRMQFSDALKISGDDSEDEEAEDAEQPARRGPGRRKRTDPILVETEDGETKYVSPAEFRKLRRRITNRLSARRMRKKHAEERALIQNTTRSLEDERNYFKHAFEQTQQRLREEEVQCQHLRAENSQLRANLQDVMRRTASPSPGQTQLTARQALQPSASFQRVPRSFLEHSDAFDTAQAALPHQTMQPLQPSFLGSFSFTDFSQAMPQDAILPRVIEHPFSASHGLDDVARGMPPIPTTSTGPSVGMVAHSLPLLLSPAQSVSQPMGAAAATSPRRIFSGRLVMQ